MASKPNWLEFLCARMLLGCHVILMRLLPWQQVFLLPLALARKRVWNRKYPICIRLAEGERAVEEEMVDGQGENQKTEKPIGHPITLFLFGRTGREKEEWFHRLLCASSYNDEEHLESVFGRM